MVKLSIVPVEYKATGDLLHQLDVFHLHDLLLLLHVSINPDQKWALVFRSMPAHDDNFFRLLIQVMYVYVIKLCISYFWLWWHLIIWIMIKMIMISMMITMMMLMMTMLSDEDAAHACTWSTRLHLSSQAAAAVLFSAPSQHFPALHNLNLEN